MRCAEVQELLGQGHSLLYFNAPVVHRTSPYVDEVDSHAYYCPECGEHLIHLLRARLRRRPGPIHLLRVNRFSLRIHESTQKASLGPVSFTEYRPIVRVANTIIQQAIKENASEIRLVIESSERPFRPDVARKPVRQVQPKPTGQDLLDAMKRDIASFGNADLQPPSGPRKRVCVSYRVRETWHEVMTMPSYIAPALWARFKSMADLLLTVHEEPQHGRIPIRYENRDYELLLDTALGEVGENLRLTIVPKS